METPSELAGWKIHNFDGIFQERWELFHAYVSLPEGQWCFWTQFTAKIEVL